MGRAGAELDLRAVLGGLGTGSGRAGELRGEWQSWLNWHWLCDALEAAWPLVQEEKARVVHMRCRSQNAGGARPALWESQADGSVGCLGELGSCQQPALKNRVRLVCQARQTRKRELGVLAGGPERGKAGVPERRALCSPRGPENPVVTAGTVCTNQAHFLLACGCQWGGPFPRRVCL